MSTWPASLPQHPSSSGYSQSIKDAVIRSSMDYGPDKLRRRSTSHIRIIQMQFVMTTEQTNTLMTFYNDTILGTGTVAWVDDLTDESVSYRFIGPPKYDCIDVDNWQVSITFEKT